MAWSSYQPQHQVRIQPDKGPTLAENAFFSSTRAVCWGRPQQELWLQVGWQGHHLQMISSSVICYIILYFNPWFKIQGSSKKHCSEVYRGPRAFSEPESRALRDFILARQISFYLRSWPGRYPFILYQSKADIFLPSIGRADSLSINNLVIISNVLKTQNKNISGGKT